MFHNRSGLVALALVATVGLPAAADAAGALAVGACGAYGYAIDFVDAAAATATAKQRCQGKGCNVVVTMKRSCAAFAIDVAGVCGAHGFAGAKNLANAQNIALQHCYKFGGKDCVIRAFACDGKR
jgi:hypothetical protein